MEILNEPSQYPRRRVEHVRLVTMAGSESHVCKFAARLKVCRLSVHAVVKSHEDEDGVAGHLGDSTPVLTNWSTFKS